MNKNTLILLAVACVLLAAAPLTAEQSVNITVAASLDVTVSFESLTGDIRFVAGVGNEVTITGTIGDDADIEVSGEDDEVDIEITLPERSRGRNLRIDANLEIRVPAGASVEVETVSATVEVSGVNGDIDIETMSGDVTVDGEAGSVEVESVSGSIRVSGAREDTDVETVSGGVVLERVSGSVSASAVSGNLEITADEVDRVDLETVSGSIEFQGALARDARLRVETYAGNVVLMLPASTSASFEVETFSGTIDNRMGGAQAERILGRREGDRFAPGKRLELTLGAGDARVTVECFSGNVTIKP